MKLFYNNKGKVCGWLKNKIYYKVVDSRKHKMKIYDAYGISKEIIDQIITEITSIRLKEEDTKRIYSSTPLNFKDKSFLKEWGDGEQYFLPLKDWVLEEDATIKLF